MRPFLPSLMITMFGFALWPCQAATSDAEVKGLTFVAASAVMEAGKAAAVLLSLEDLKSNKVPEGEVKELEAEERKLKARLADAERGLAKAKVDLKQGVAEDAPKAHWAHLQAVDRYESICEHALASWSHAIKAKRLSQKEGQARLKAEALWSRKGLCLRKSEVWVLPSEGVSA